MHTFPCLAAIAVAIVLPYSALLARADVYRCVMDGGHVSYQQIPCDMQSQPMELNKQPSGWSSLRPGERDLLKRYHDRDATLRRKSADSPKSPHKENKACWKKRRQLDAVRSRLHGGYKLKEGNELHRKRSDYEDYLRRFCS